MAFYKTTANHPVVFSVGFYQGEVTITFSSDTQDLCEMSLDREEALSLAERLKDVATFINTGA